MLNAICNVLLVIGLLGLLAASWLIYAGFHEQSLGAGAFLVLGAGVGAIAAIVLLFTVIVKVVLALNNRHSPPNDDAW